MYYQMEAGTETPEKEACLGLPDYVLWLSAWCFVGLLKVGIVVSLVWNITLHCVKKIRHCDWFNGKLNSQ